MWTVSTTKGVSLFSSVWELGTPLFYQCPILGVQFNPPSPPAPLPWGEGSMLHKKQKGLTQTHRKVPLPPRPKPHHLMKCEKGAWRSHVPFSHFGGRGGTGPPTKKNENRAFYNNIYCSCVRRMETYKMRGVSFCPCRYFLFGKASHYARSQFCRIGGL